MHLVIISSMFTPVGFSHGVILFVAPERRELEHVGVLAIVGVLGFAVGFCPSFRPSVVDDVKVVLVNVEVHVLRVLFISDQFRDHGIVMRTASLSCHFADTLFHELAMSLSGFLVTMCRAAWIVRLMSLSMSLVCGMKLIRCGWLPKYTV